MLSPRNTGKCFSHRDIPRNSCWWGFGLSPGIPLDQPRLEPREFFIPVFSGDPKTLPKDLFQHLGISQQLQDPFGASGILSPVGNVEILDPPGRGVGKIPLPPIPEGNAFIPFLIAPFPRILPTSKLPIPAKHSTGKEELSLFSTDVLDSQKNPGEEPLAGLGGAGMGGNKGIPGILGGNSGLGASHNPIIPKNHWDWERMERRGRNLG